MDSDGIFLASGDDFVVLKQTPYETEAVLQRALAEHPDVIAGPTTAGNETGRLLLVRREMPVKAVLDGPQVWSADHLFLDADAVPVVVEVKRATDTRVRREVVGQILDYAAGGVRFWPIADLRASVEARAVEQGTTGDDLVNQLQPGMDPEEFWKAVEANLASGRIRMLIVADELPRDLIRVIEFLNEQMSPAEVLGVEVRQFVGAGHIVYVPRVVGRTSAAVATKTTANGQQWGPESFLDAARSRRTEPEVQMMEQLLKHIDEKGLRPGWGKGVTPGVSGWYTVAGAPAAVWNLNVNGANANSRAYLYFYLGDLAKRLPPEAIESAAKILEAIPAMTAKIRDARASNWNKYPSVYLPDIAASAHDVTAIFAAIETLADPGT